MTNDPAPTRGRKKRGLVWLSVLVFAGLAITMVGIYAVSDFQRSEAKIEAFCRLTEKGEALPKVRSRANAAGFSIRPGTATGPFGSSLSVWATSAILPDGSFCSVYHDGKAVTHVSYNPWFH